MHLDPNPRRFRVLAALSIWVVLGLACSATGSPTLNTERRGTPFPPVAVSVFAADGWQDTGLVLDRRDVVEIEYLYGKWAFWLGQVPPHDAQGDPGRYICAEVMPSDNCTEELPEAVKGSLIARIENSHPIAIGASAVFVASSRGRLFLSINDAHTSLDLSDNVGSVVVQITVSPSE